MSSLEILCVGKELLIGKTLNTNENWLAKRATTLGIEVTRITTVGDELNEIEKAIKEILGRKTRFVVTSGGLGPTYDDITLQGAAQALGRSLKLDDKALEMVKKKYKAYAEERELVEVDLTPARIKMAMLPEGSTPLFNPVGTAPGVQIEIDSTHLFLLPGVPNEMKAIFDDSIVPQIKREVRDYYFSEDSVDVYGIGESSMAPLLEKAMQENPYVYIKSHPRIEERIPHVEIHLSTTSRDPEETKERLNKAKRQIEDFIESLRAGLF